MPTRSITPLAIEPAPPIVLSQEALPQGASDLAKCAQWRYHLRYWHPHAPPDEVFITATFNTLPESDETSVATDDAPPRFEDRLIAQLVYSDDGERIQSLRLTRESDGVGASHRWPHAEYHASGGVIAELGNGIGDGTTRTYAFDPPVESDGGSSTLSLSWEALAVSRAQRASASLFAMRNRGVAGEDPTMDIVVFHTATVDARNTVAPYIRWPQEIDISELGDTIEAALDAAFCTVFDERRIGQPVSLKIDYAYAISPSTDPELEILATLPATMVPRLLVTETSAAEIATALATWKDALAPETRSARWLISLVALSQLDTRAPTPMLELGRLLYRLR
ncbi:MAG: hypothetical protein ABI411_12840 [Tahibacter sp.]